jgi:hypothetical protein
MQLFKKIRNGILSLFPSLSFFVLKNKYQSYACELALKKLPLIVQMEYGGLGDQVVWSGFPEALFKKYGVKTVISLQSPFRSEEIKDFVWGGNPYVSFSEEPGMTILLPHVKAYQNYNEILFALFDLEGSLFSLPYRPKPRPELAEKVVCDMSLGPSHVYNESGTQAFWDAVPSYLTEHFKKEDILLVEPTSPYPVKTLTYYLRDKLGVSTISVGSIAELTDVLCAAKERVLLDSGSKSITAVYGKHAFVLVRGFRNTFFSYPSNDHIVL